MWTTAGESEVGEDIGAFYIHGTHLRFTDEDGIAIRLSDDDAVVKCVTAAGYPLPRAPPEAWATDFARVMTWFKYLRGKRSLQPKMMIQSEGIVKRKEGNKIGYSNWTDEGDSGAPVMSQDEVVAIHVGGDGTKDGKDPCNW